MQDNISCALITAFERQYDTSWDDPKLRNERLAMRYGWTAAMEAKQCLHQIQEPAAAEQAAWHAGLDEGREQAAPAAVAVPDAVRDAEKLLRAEAARLERIYNGYGNKWYGFSNEKAAHIEHLCVADALAATPAAAPVVLPEPEAVISEVMELVQDWAQRDLIAVEAGIDTLTEESSEKEHQEAKRLDGEAETAYRAIETKLRALLATATGLPAQAVANDNFKREIYAALGCGNHRHP